MPLRAYVAVIFRIGEIETKFQQFSEFFTEIGGSGTGYEKGTKALQLSIYDDTSDFDGDGMAIATCSAHGCITTVIVAAA